jgi:KUP system potassium uptake protein
VPKVSNAQRIQIHGIGHGFWQIKVAYGFMEIPDIPKVLAGCVIGDYMLDAFSTSYFVSRETVIPGPGGEMAYWRDQLFAAMSRNAGSVVRYFNIPANSVIELGSRVHI